MKIWKLISAIAVTIALFVGSPYVLAWLGLVSPLTPNAWIILFVTSVGLILKIVFGDIVSGEFQYYKHGYDFCIITFGATLSSLSIQLTSDKDLFPGLPATGLLSVFGAVSPDIVVQRRIGRDFALM